MSEDSCAPACSVTVSQILFLFVILLPLVANASTVDSESGRGITLSDLLAIRDITSMVVSPDGRYVAYHVVQADIDENRHELSLYVTPTITGSEPVLALDLGYAQLATNSAGRQNGQLFSGEIVWSPNSDWIAFTASKNGEVQLWRSQIDEADLEQLTHNDADVENPVVSADGASILFAVGRDRAAMSAANTAEARRGYLEQYPPLFYVGRGPVWPPCKDGRERWDHEINDSRECQLSIWTIDLRSGTERLATDAEVGTYFSEADSAPSTVVRRGSRKNVTRLMETMSPDGMKSAWFQNEDPSVFNGPRYPVRVAVAQNGTLTLCRIRECRQKMPSQIWWSSDSDEVIFLVRDGRGRTLHSLYAWDVGEDRVRTIYRGDEWFDQCQIAQGRLICLMETWISPRKIVALELSSSAVSTIVDKNAEFQKIRFTQVEKIFGMDEQGNLASGHLVYPEGYEPGLRYPLIIVQYVSRGFLRGGVGDEHPIHVYAHSGFAILSFNTPDGDYMEKEGDSRKLQAAYLKYLLVDSGPASAIESIIDDLVDKGVVDPARIGISGLSHGATTTDSTLLRRNYTAASTAYSVSASPVFEAPSSSNWGNAVNLAFGGTPYTENGSKNRKIHSIAWNADRIETPYLIQVADREYHITKQNYSALLDAGKPVEMWVYPDEYHVKWQPAHRYNVYRRNLQWFQFWLQNIEVDDPVDPEQYTRWRKMRTDHCANMNADGRRELPIYCEAE